MGYTNDCQETANFNDIKQIIIEYIEKNLNERRLKHTYSVVREAVKLAEH